MRGTITPAQYRKLSRSKKGRTPESLVKAAIGDLCKLKGWLLVPVPAGVTSLPGSPDYYLHARGRIIAVEVKRTTGGRLSDAQLAFQEECHRTGTPYLICTDVLKLEAYIEQKQIPQF